MTTKTFEVGKTYDTRSICDHNCWFSITVAKRTAKTITTTTGKVLRPYIYNGVEQVKPNGSYSMCAIIGADDEGRKVRALIGQSAMATIGQAIGRPYVS